MRISFIIFNTITHNSHHQETDNTLNNNFKNWYWWKESYPRNGFYNLFLFDVYFVNFVFLKLLATFDLYFRKIYQHSKPFSNPFLRTQKLVQSPLQLIKWSTSMCSGTLHSTVNVGVKLVWTIRKRISFFV